MSGRCGCCGWCCWIWRGAGARIGGVGAGGGTVLESDVDTDVDAVDDPSAGGGGGGVGPGPGPGLGPPGALGWVILKRAILQELSERPIHSERAWISSLIQLWAFNTVWEGDVIPIGGDTKLMNDADEIAGWDTSFLEDLGE